MLKIQISNKDTLKITGGFIDVQNFQVNLYGSLDYWHELLHQAHGFW